MRLPFTLPQSASSVDVVIYTSSLASDSRAVDPILDQVRVITSELSPNAQLSDTQEATIADVYVKLENYLIQKDPQRIFTQQELRQKIFKHFDATSPLSKLLRFKLWGIIALTVLASGAVLLVPQAPTEDSWLEFYALLVLPTIFTVLHFGAAWLFASALNNFRLQLKLAYGLVVAGIVVLGLAQAQLVVIGAFDWWNTVWINSGIVTIIYVPAFLLLYIGMRYFGRAVGVLIPGNLTLVLGALVMGGGLVFVVPHVAGSPTTDLFFHLSAFGMAAGFVVAAAATITARRIYKTVTTLYKPALGWLRAALAGVAISILHLLIVHLFVGYDTWYVDYGIVLVPFLLSAIIFVKAGYSFNKLSSY